MRKSAWGSDKFLVSTVGLLGRPAGWQFRYSNQVESIIIIKQDCETPIKTDCLKGDRIYTNTAIVGSL